MLQYEFKTLESLLTIEENQENLLLNSLLIQYKCCFQAILHIEYIKVLKRRPSLENFKRFPSIYLSANTVQEPRSTTITDFERTVGTMSIFNPSVNQNIDKTIEDYNTIIATSILEAIFTTEYIDTDVVDMFIETLQQYYESIHLDYNYSNLFIIC